VILYHRPFYKLALANAKKKELTDRLDKEKNGKVNDVLKGLFKK
jgi:hypothetical protein